MMNPITREKGRSLIHVHSPALAVQWEMAVTERDHRIVAEATVKISEEWMRRTGSTTAMDFLDLVNLKYDLDDCIEETTFRR